MAALLLAATACSSDDTTSTSPTSSPPAASGTATDPAQACGQVRAQGDALVAAVRALIAGSGSRDQVQAAAQGLADAARSGYVSAQSELQADADKVRAAAEQLDNALKATPRDTAGATAAARSLDEALKGVSRACPAPATGTPTGSEQPSTATTLSPTGPPSATSTSMIPTPTMS